MKLYLNLNIPTGKQVGYIDTQTGKIVKVVVLYPDKPTEIEDKLAERLLRSKANQGIVGLEPFCSNPVVENVTSEPSEQEKMLETLKKIADTELEICTVKELNAMFVAIGADVPEPAMGKAKRIEALNAACEKALASV